MAYCRKCHSQVAVTDLDRDGRCAECAAARAKMLKKYGMKSDPKPKTPPKPAPVRVLAEKVVLSGEGVIPAGYERLGMVFGESAIGIGLVGDLKVELRDTFGGRSGTIEKSINTARAEVLGQIQRQAARLGADLVVAVSVAVTDFGGRGAAFVVIGSGTVLRKSDAGAVT